MPRVTLKTPHYRIDDPESALSVRFTCDKSSPNAAPKVRARLVRQDKATPFATHRQAAECFARFLAGQALDIVRVDA